MPPHSRLSFIYAALAICFSTPLSRCFAQSAEFTRLDSTVAQLMKQAKVPGLSLALIRNNQPVYHKAYGLLKADSSAQTDVNTVFEAASLTKPVFAYVVLQLMEEGKIDLDKPLYEYLPYPDAAGDERYKKITARLVLSHRSGFPNWRKNRQSGELTLRAAPGEKFGYSGEGFVYLQKVIEHLTGQAINELMEERALKPLGMSRSGFVWKPSFDTNFARPHNEEGEAWQKSKPGRANMAYSLHTTAHDYARFILAIFNATGLKQSTVAQMLTPQVSLPERFSGSDTTAPYSFWGLGIGIEKNPTDTYVWHWGDNGAFKCFVMANATRKEGIVYFANSANGLDFADELIRQTLGGQHPAFAFLSIDWQKKKAKKP